jgi:integrase
VVWTAGEGVKRLWKDTKVTLGEATAKSSSKATRKTCGDYLAWLAEVGMTVSDQSMTMFLHRRMVSPQVKCWATLETDRKRLWSVCRWSERNPADSPMVADLMRAARCVLLPPGTNRKKHLTKKLLTRVLDHLGLATRGVRDTCMMALMFMGFLRESEAVNLRTEDVWVGKEGGERVLFVFLRTSKADKEKRGVTVVVAGSLILSLVDAWLCDRAPTSEWFFHGARGEKLSRTYPCKVMQSSLREIGVDDWKMYGSHSCRSGGATAAWERGLAVELIKRHGRRKSDAVFLYLRSSLKTRLRVSLALNV